MESYIRTIGPRMAAGGYQLCAISPGKKCPLYPDWRAKPLSALTCSTWENARAGVGVICGTGAEPVCAIDVDVEGDKDLASAIYRRFASQFPAVVTAPFRVGKPPKFLLVFRAESANWRKATTAFFEKDGTRIRLEALGKGQQFVAYHIHPDTRKPYLWPDEMNLFGDLADTPASALPVIRQEDVSEMIRIFEEMALEAGYTRVAGSQATLPTGGGDDDELMQMLTPKLPPLPGIDIDTARRMVHESGIDLNDFNQWLKLGMALHHQFSGSEDGLQLWDELSSEAPEKYKGPEDCRYRWGTFRRDDDNGTTFRWVQSEWRKAKQAEPKIYGDAWLGYFVKARHGRRIRYAVDANRWYVFSEENAIWEPDGEPFVRALIKEAIEDGVREHAEYLRAHGGDEAVTNLWSEWSKWLKNLAAMIDRVIRVLKADPYIFVSATDFDADTSLLGVANGVLNLQSMELLPSTPDMLVSKRMGASYAPSAKCPRWEKALLEWLDGDVEMAAYTKRLMGYALLGKPTEDKMAVFHGKGANGKSVCLDTLTRLFGSYAVSVREETISQVGRAFATSGSAAAPDIVSLAGARFVVCPETADGARFKESLVKRLTGRDVIKARELREKDIEFRPSWLLVIATNYIPQIKGDDDGIWRRMLFTEFPRNFESDPKLKKDPELTDKLTAELPGILNWALEGAAEYKQNGLGIPQKVTSEVAEYREEMDVLASWLGVCCADAGDDARVSVPELYTSFKEHMRRAGEPSDMTRNTFTRRVKKRLADKEFKKIMNVHYVYGLRMRTPEELSGEDPLKDFE